MSQLTGRPRREGLDIVSGSREKQIVSLEEGRLRTDAFVSVMEGHSATTPDISPFQAVTLFVFLYTNHTACIRECYGSFEIPPSFGLEVMGVKVHSALFTTSGVKLTRSE